MKLEPIMPNLREDMFISPLPSVRLGSANVSVNLNVSDGEISDDEFNAIRPMDETDEGRLSRSLQTWMVDHEWKVIQPMEKPVKQPVFSGRLGIERKHFPRKKRVLNGIRNQNGTFNQTTKTQETPRAKTAQIRRVPSDESIRTSLSLLTCSSVEVEKPVEVIKIKKKRRKRACSRAASRASNETQSEETVPFKSIWVEFATKRSRNLNRLFRTHAVLNDIGIIGGDEFSDESEAFRKLDRDEQTALFNCGMTRGIKYVDRAGLYRSGSLSKLDRDQSDIQQRHATRVKRALSASARKPYTRLMDLNDFRRERVERLKKLEQERLTKEKERKRRKRHSMSRKSSSKSLIEVPQLTSSSTSQQNQNVASSPVSPSNTQAPVKSANSVRSGQSSEVRPFSPTDNPSSRSGIESNRNTSMWKGDREILEIDLKRELTVRVKEKITITRHALKRVTGLGEGNEQRFIIGKHDEFPNHIEDDYAHKPRIIQKMRISPHLSGVIHEDIQVRMGRPRYHEIRSNDLEQWNKGQSLNRAHRNLKVFNWLHSLKEYDFKDFLVPEVLGEPDDDHLADDFETLHVEAADEPDVKPLYRAYAVRML